MRGEKKKKNLMRTTLLQEEGWVTEMQEVGALVLWEKEKREAWDLEMGWWVVIFPPCLIAVQLPGWTCREPEAF